MAASRVAPGAPNDSRAGGWRDAPVIIDARAAARREIGGVERVTLEMSRRLPQIRPERYSVARPPRALAYRAGHVWEQALLPLMARPACLIYCPANLAPVASRRTVLMIHDLAPLRHPDWYSRAFAAYQARLLPLLARRARRIIVPSEFSRRELIEALDVPGERISVVPNGVDESFSRSADTEPVRRLYDLSSPYVLLVGTRIARKNLTALRIAARRLRQLGIELVSAGSDRYWARAEQPPPMRMLGYVDEKHLPGLYAGAAALAMPSLYEGFGLPALEAMACAVPVVASDRGALPEVCGDAAVLVSPDDAAGLSDALEAVVTDQGLRARLVAAGPERAAPFRWSRTAAITDAVIGSALET